MKQEYIGYQIYKESEEANEIIIICEEDILDSDKNKNQLISDVFIYSLLGYEITEYSNKKIVMKYVGEIKNRTSTILFEEIFGKEGIWK